MSVVEWEGPLPDPAVIRSAHLMGIGGAGMSGVARLLAAQGMTISGCDAKDSAALPPLRAIGIEVAVGHDPAHVADVGALVVSSAIRADNQELEAAAAADLPVLPRAVALAMAMAHQRGIAIAGTHGKTTTTSMLTVALQACGRDPSYAIGGDLNEPGSNAHHGTGSFFVAEADESDRSFLVLQPQFAVVTNVEADHLDNYRDAADVDAAFDAFVSRLPANGALIAGHDDPGSARLRPVAAAAGVEAVTFGIGGGDVRVDQLRLFGDGSSFDLVFRGSRLGTVRLSVPGRYNARNAAAALATGLHLGLPFADLARGIAGFRGVRRRFEPRGVSAGVRLYDDYAHHPTEVRAVLEAARLAAGNGRLIAVFQPHLFSRTRSFAADFGNALAGADEVVVMDVYPAREDPIPGVTGALVADAVGLAPGRVRFEPSWQAVAAHVAELARPGDLVVTIGAGDVTMLAPALARALDEAS